MSTIDSIDTNTSPAASGYTGYADLPNVPQRVLNPNQAAMSTFNKAWGNGLLNPNQNTVGGRYNTIDSAYLNVCTISSNYYTMRK